MAWKDPSIKQLVLIDLTINLSPLMHIPVSTQTSRANILELKLGEGLVRD